MFPFDILTRIKKLKAAGVIGLNYRNLYLIQAKNPRRLFPHVDSKIISKRLAQDAGLPVPELYMIIDSYARVKKSYQKLLQYDSFVVKPEHGSGGEGILVLNQKEGDFYRLNGNKITWQEIRQHLNNILSGLHSLGGHPDRAFIEYKVEFADEFDHLFFQGTPDIRIIVVDGKPTTAMMRLPTKASNNKANLHQGAVGLGVDIKTGCSQHAIQFDREIEFHPDTGVALKDVKINNWEDILEYARQCYHVYQLGYLGVDLVIDKNLGPLLLEVNARPGLAIQIANQKGLLESIGK